MHIVRLIVVESDEGLIEKPTGFESKNLPKHYNVTVVSCTFLEHWRSRQNRQNEYDGVAILHFHKSADAHIHGHNWPFPNGAFRFFERVKQGDVRRPSILQRKDTC